MGWQELLGQQRVADSLARAVASNRVAHAYLFHGPDGSGKRAFALEFAKVLQCERGGDFACDTCDACHKVSRLTHPDVKVLFPYPKDTPAENVTERLAIMAENPYREIDFVRRPSLADPLKSSNKQSFYPVIRIHEELRRAMSFRAHEGRYKIAILTGAELLRVEAANAFLKLLEEPTGQTVFILTTSRTDRLLPTIISRCQRLRFDPLPVEIIEKALLEREGAEPPQAGMLARMADGSYSRALDLLQNQELITSRTIVLEFLRQAYNLKVDIITELVDRITASGREQVKGMLALMLQWVRDLVLFREAGRDAPLVNIDQIDAIQRFSQNLPNADLESMADVIQEAIDLSERNVNLTLALVVLAHRLRDAMRGKAVKLMT